MNEVAQEPISFPSMMPAAEMLEKVKKELEQLKGKTIDIFYPADKYAVHMFKSFQNDYTSVANQLRAIMVQNITRYKPLTANQISFAIHPPDPNCPMLFFENEGFNLANPRLEYRPYALDGSVIDLRKPGQKPKLVDLYEDKTLEGRVIAEPELDGFTSAVHHGFEGGHPIPTAISLLYRLGKACTKPHQLIRENNVVAKQIFCYFPLGVIPVTSKRKAVTFAQTNSGKVFRISGRFESSGALLCESFRGNLVYAVLTDSTIDPSSIKMERAPKPWFEKPLYEYQQCERLRSRIKSEHIQWLNQGYTG